MSLANQLPKLNEEYYRKQRESREAKAMLKELILRLGVFVGVIAFVYLMAKLGF